MSLRRRKRLIIGLEMGAAAVIAAMALLGRRPLLVRWHLAELLRKPERFEEYLEAPPGSDRREAFQRFVQREEGCRVLFARIEERHEKFRRGSKGRLAGSQSRTETMPLAQAEEISPRRHGDTEKMASG
jgi:hypothetical protein